MVQTLPGSSLEVVKTEFFFHLLVCGLAGRVHRRGSGSGERLRPSSRDCGCLLLHTRDPYGIGRRSRCFAAAVRAHPAAIVRELALTGRRLRADEAIHLGFVNRVAPDIATALDVARELGTEISTKSPLAIWGRRRS